MLETPNGEELLSIQAKVLHVRDTMTIERGGRKVATVKKALVSPLRDRFSIDVDGGDDMEAKGNIVDHEYKIERDGTRWPRFRVGGSAFATAMVSKSHPDKTTPSCSPWSSASTR